MINKIRDIYLSECKCIEKNCDNKISYNNWKYGNKRCRNHAAKLRNNLITLCQSCNSQVNANRDYWYSYFRHLKDND